MRLVCRKFQSLIDNYYDKLFNLRFRLIVDNMEKQELEKVIKNHPIIKSFIFKGYFNDYKPSNYIPNENFIICIPDDTKELKIQQLKIEQHSYNKDFKFPLSLKSLKIRGSLLSLNHWKLILSLSSLSSLSFWYNTVVDKGLIMVAKKFVIKKFPSNLEKLDLKSGGEIFHSCVNLTDLREWPRNLVDLRLTSLIISSDEILKLSILSTLFYLELHYIEGIIEIDLSNFKSLKYLAYSRIPSDEKKQYVIFPSSLSFQHLSLSSCDSENVKSTKLPNSLIHLEIFSPTTDFISFLLKEENKIPLLQSLTICTVIIKDIKKILHQYNGLKILKFTNLACMIDHRKKIDKIKEDIDELFSYIPPNISTLKIHQCPKQYISNIVKLFPSTDFFEVIHFNALFSSLFFNFTKK